LAIMFTQNRQFPIQLLNLGANPSKNNKIWIII
jgi:hypothetical protein